MKNKPSLILEIVWIIIGLVSFYLSVKEFININNRQASIFLMMAAVSFLLAWFRDRQRKKT